MSMSQYLWAVARGLRTEVYPGTEAGVPRDALENSIRILTTIANALEATAPTDIGRPSAIPLPETREDNDRLPGPPENSAAYGDTAAALARIAASLDDGIASPDEGEARMLIAWEKALLDAAIGRMDRVERASATHIDDPHLRIDPRALESFLRQQTGAPDLIVSDFRPVLGGRSRQTALFSVNELPDLPDKLVIQRALPGLATNPAFVSEAGQFEVLDTLYRAGLKVPRPLFLDPGSDTLGAPFIILERSPGSPAQSDYWLPVGSEEVALDLARQMAMLHAQPIDRLGPMLPRSRERYDREGWLEELDRLAQDWHQLAHWPSVTMSAAIAWMRANVDCVEDRRTLVHNDMIFHNILAENDRITAILDWEQTSIGHPGEDLGYCYPVVCAVTDWERFLAVYAEAGGPPISQRQIDYFSLRAGLRLMNLVLKGGRDAFESGRADDVLVASAGAHFSQRLLHRIAGVLESVRARA